MDFGDTPDVLIAKKQGIYCFYMYFFVKGIILIIGLLAAMIAMRVS